MTIENSRLYLDSFQSAYDLMSLLLDENHTIDELCLFLEKMESQLLTAIVLDGFQQAIMERATQIAMGDQETIDICGTGGDGKNTINISTLAALTLAGMGYKVVKHGNSGFSSGCGSSDVLTTIGVTLPKSENEVCQQLSKSSISFIHAPYFHPALKSIGIARKKYGKRTVFNLLGPLCNPALPTASLFGVPDKHIYDLYCSYLKASSRNAAVIFDHSGYDEISLTNQVSVSYPKKEFIVSPDTFEVNKQKSSDIQVDSKEQTIASFVRIADGQGTPQENRVIAANSAVAAGVIKTSASIADLFQEALAVLQDGSIKQILKKLGATV